MLLNLESGAYAFTADPDEGTLSVGRENDCNFVVKEEGVSRHHCKLWFEAGEWLVEDTESRHGTVINNKQVHKPTVLKSGDVLRLSSVTFVVSLHRTNDPKEIGKQLAGGAREKLKLINQNQPKGPPAKPTRIMKAPAKGSNPKLKPAAAVVEEEPSEAQPDEEVAATTQAAAPESDAPADTETEDAPAEKKSASKVRPGAKASAAKSRTKGGKPAKEAPRKGGALLKIVGAVVIFLGAGAGAYYGLGMNAETAPESKPGDTKTETSKEEVPAIPAKPADAPPKDDTPSAPDAKTEGK